MAKKKKNTHMSSSESKTQALKAETTDFSGIRPNSGIKRETIERFLSYVKKGKGCWQWQGSFTKDGYGQFWLAENKVVKTHRIAYEIFCGKLTPKQRLKNTCNNKSCVNPFHWTIAKS